MNFLLPERDKQAFWTTRFGRSDPLWLDKYVPPEDEPHFDKSVMAAKDELGDLGGGGAGKPFFEKKKGSLFLISFSNQ